LANSFTGTPEGRLTLRLDQQSLTVGISQPKFVEKSDPKLAGAVPSEVSDDRLILTQRKPVSGVFIATS
jgi:hypothetical protein